MIMRYISCKHVSLSKYNPWSQVCKSCDFKVMTSIHGFMSKYNIFVLVQDLSANIAAKMKPSVT